MMLMSLGVALNSRGWHSVAVPVVGYILVRQSGGDEKEQGGYRSVLLTQFPRVKRG